MATLVGPELFARAKACRANIHPISLLTYWIRAFHTNGVC
jgi:hypothetical protein